MWSVMQSTLGALAEQIAKHMLLLHTILFCTGLDKQIGHNALQKQRVVSSEWKSANNFYILPNELVGGNCYPLTF